VEEILEAFNSHRISEEKAWPGYIGLNGDGWNAWRAINLSLLKGDRTVIFISCRRKNSTGFIRS